MELPLTLHRYMSGPSGSAYALENLEKLVMESRLRVSRPTDFNDPFDCRALFSTNGASSEALAVFLENRLLARAPERPTRLLAELNDAAQPDPAGYARLMLHLAQESMTRYLERVRMVCFCEPGMRGEPDNLLLWSYYADGHRGMCLVFDSTVLMSKAKACLRKVAYRTQYPSLLEYSAGDWERLHDLVLFSKSKQWEHELEWRLVVDARFADDGCILLPTRSLVAIVLGTRMPEGDREAVHHLAQKSQQGAIKVVQAHRHLEEYGLSFSTVVA